MKSATKSHNAHKLEHTEIIPVSTFLKPVVIGVIFIPVSLFFWLFGALKSSFLSSDGSFKFKHLMHTSSS